MSAIFSPCGLYRYELRRHWGPADSSNVMAFCLINPSKAGAIKGDQTTTIGMGFAKRAGCDGMAFYNLYAFASKDPAHMLAQRDPIGPENDKYLRQAALEFPCIICAWGVNADPDRAMAVVNILKAEGARLYCLGTTKGGHPRHPLRLPYSTLIVPYHHRGAA